MDGWIERCCGLDVHKQTVAACVRVPGAQGRRTQEVRTFGTTDGEEIWSFGDGATATTKSDGNVEEHAKNGFAATTHVFTKPGDYIVRVERSNRPGQKAIAHLWVRVGGTD